MSDEKRKPLVFEVEPEPEAEREIKKEAPPKAAKRPEVFDPPRMDEPSLPAVTAIESIADNAGRGFRWGRVLIGALGGLLSITIGVWFWSLTESLFARLPALGWVSLTLVGIALFAALAIVTKTFASYRRLREITSLHKRIDDAGPALSLKEAHAIGDEIFLLFRDRADMAAARQAVNRHRNDVMDGADYLAIVEKALLAPLDARATSLISDAVKRVSVVTAVSPRAFIDLAVVLYENARLISRLGALYGGRPSRLAFLSLARRTFEHLAVTGAVAVGDSVLQQALGHGLAAKLSARLGEGVLNGFLTARIGLSAMDVSRPMPFNASPQPRFSQLMSEVTRLSSKDEEKV
ncbi:MAG: TIGR01620 family protein [Pseudomonadota bacterium]